MAASHLRPGEVFLGKYRILRVVGEGGMGHVYAAHHLLLDKAIAIKVLSKEVSANPEHVTRFLNEARLAAKIKSAHVCSVMDVGQLEDGRPYLVMELLEGGDLASALRARGIFPIWDIVDIALGAIEGLVHAHVRGIVHRDLKPSNLFLSHEAEGGVVVKVLDFGISKFEAMNEQRLPSFPEAEQIILGSPAYMSPEQIRDARSVDIRADIWSLGVIMYELATGVCPFDAPSPPETFAKILGSTSPVPASKLREVPAVLEAAIARCLRRNPDERFSTVLELAQAIAPIRPGADAAVARIAAVMARPKASLADSSTGLPALEAPAHATNVSWVHGAPSRTNRRAMGLGAAGGVAVLLAILLFVAQRKQHAASVVPAPTAYAAANAPPAIASSSVVAASPDLPVAASITPPDPSSVPVPSASSAQGVTQRPASRPGSAHPPPKPSKQELLKDRR